MHIPEKTSLDKVYGKENLSNSIKILTLAPELPGAITHIEALTKDYNFRVSMGHSAATYS